MEVINDTLHEDGNAEVNPEKKFPDNLVNTEVDVEKHVKDTPILETAVNTGGLEPGKNNARVSYTDKENFIKSIIHGGRYVSEMSLLGGELHVKFRSRSENETSAILSILRKWSIDGKIKSDYEYSRSLRLMMLSLQLAEMNGTCYPENTSELLYTSESGEEHPPKWLDSVELWKSKPESLVQILISALGEFEAKYWKMIEMSRTANFWLPGESTGS